MRGRPFKKGHKFLGDLTKPNYFQKGHKRTNLGERRSPGTEFKKGHKAIGGFKKGHEISKELRIKLSEIRRNSIGKKSPRWKGGITPLNVKLRTSSMYKIWHEAVFIRDNFTCQNLNCEYCHNKMGVYLHAHHIKPWAKYPELRFVISNGITYCLEFHVNSKILHKEVLKEVIIWNGDSQT